LKRHIPNALTLGNLFCGCLALLNLWTGNAFALLTGCDVDFTVVLVLAGAVLDLLDGAVARALGVSGELGKQLDSLADAVTFGVVPAMLLAHIVLVSHAYAFAAGWGLMGAAGAALLIAPASALRLGRFNLDTRQADGFIGLPTPANALFVCSVYLTAHSPAWRPVVDALLGPWLVIGLSLGLCWLLNSPLPLLAFKFKGGVRLATHWPQLALLAVGAACLALLGVAAGPAILVAYVALSLVAARRGRSRPAH
jgi:CDP-diacylglycerol--serine O-phosphatidyltransferase